jgi:hypothetical protein
VSGDGTVDLVVNGAHLGEAAPSDLGELERPLRPLALATSPILLRGPAAECLHVIRRLHALSRRASHPLRLCEAAADADPLLTLEGPTPPAAEAVAGTWALFGVELWDEARQRHLARVLETLDHHRLAGALHHEHIPRVLVAVGSEREAERGFVPELLARLSFFKLELHPRPS